MFQEGILFSHFWNSPHGQDMEKLFILMSMIYGKCKFF